MPPSRDKLRAATVGKKKTFKRKTVRVDGLEFDLVAPSIRERGDLRHSCMVEDGDEVILDYNRFLCAAVILCTFVPGTTEKVFEDQDLDGLLEQPTGGWVDQIAEEVMELVNVKKDDKKDNLKKTGGAKSSSA